VGAVRARRQPVVTGRDGCTALWLATKVADLISEGAT